MTVLPVNLWASAAGQSLYNTANGGKNTTNDVFHAVFNDVKMNGGGGGDHFHIMAGTTGATIKDFRYGEGDLIVLDGYSSIDPTKFSVVKTGKADYTITYDKTTFKIDDLRQGNGELWDISAEKLKGQLFPAGSQGKYVRLGQLDANADYYYGFKNITAAAAVSNLNKTFQITGERPVYITGFSGDENRHNLSFKASLKAGGDLASQFLTSVNGNKEGGIKITQGAKVLAYLTPPPETTSIGNWYDNTIEEIGLAATNLGVRSAIIGTPPKDS